jgi:hypothetical protein
MNPAISELHATARRNELLADAERCRLARQARVQRRTRAAKAGALATLASCLGTGGKRRAVVAHTA